MDFKMVLEILMINMDKKLILKTKFGQHLYVAVFTSLGIALIWFFYGLIAMIKGQSHIEAFMLTRSLLYALAAVWAVFLLVRLFYNTVIEVDDLGITKKVGNRVEWRLAWDEITNAEYHKLPWYFFIEPNRHCGVLVLTYTVHQQIDRKYMLDLSRWDIKRINKTFNKDIKTY